MLDRKYLNYGSMSIMRILNILWLSMKWIFSDICQKPKYPPSTDILTWKNEKVQIS